MKTVGQFQCTFGSGHVCLSSVVLCSWKLKWLVCFHVVIQLYFCFRPYHGFAIVKTWTVSRLSRGSTVTGWSLWQVQTGLTLKYILRKPHTHVTQWMELKYKCDECDAYEIQIVFKQGMNTNNPSLFSSSMRQKTLKFNKNWNVVKTQWNGKNGTMVSKARSRDLRQNGFYCAQPEGPPVSMWYKL